jgi:hypothetical protein
MRRFPLRICGSPPSSAPRRSSSSDLACARTEFAIEGRNGSANCGGHEQESIALYNGIILRWGPGTNFPAYAKTADRCAQNPKNGRCFPLLEEMSLGAREGRCVPSRRWSIKRKEDKKEAEIVIFCRKRKCRYENIEKCHSGTADTRRAILSFEVIPPESHPMQFSPNSGFAGDTLAT